MSDKELLFLMSAAQAEAFSKFVEAANRGDGGAACRLGDMYREGLGGLRYSPKQTFRWYSRSALAGDVDGQNNLGACYEHGLGCEQSYIKAVKWYRLAAARQHGTASMNLGYCYLRGKGLPADKEEALRLFRLAVEQGESKAADELERLGELAEDSRVQVHRRIRFVDETESGRHFGLVGLAGVARAGASEPDEQRIQCELVDVQMATDSNPAQPIEDGGNRCMPKRKKGGAEEVAFKRWVLATWLLDKWDNWDPVNVTDISASEVMATKDEQTKLYGEPEVSFGDGGETVTFTWHDGPYANITLRQKPCN